MDAIRVVGSVASAGRHRLVSGPHSCAMLTDLLIREAIDFFEGPTTRAVAVCTAEEFVRQRTSRLSRKLEMRWRSETDDNNSFTILGNTETRGVQTCPVQVVAGHFVREIQQPIPVRATVRRKESWHILEQKRARPQFCNEFEVLESQLATWVVKCASPAQDAEGLDMVAPRRGGPPPPSRLRSSDLQL